MVILIVYAVYVLPYPNERNPPIGWFVAHEAVIAVRLSRTKKAARYSPQPQAPLILRVIPLSQNPWL